VGLRLSHGRVTLGARPGYGCPVGKSNPAPVHPYMEEAPSTEEVKVGDLQLMPGDTLTYLFDFGDRWLF